MYHKLRYRTRMAQSTQSERLKRARLHAGFKDKAEVCRNHGWPYETYKKHESDGESARQIDADWAEKYGRVYAVDPAFILWGTHPPSWWDGATTTMRPQANFRSVPRLTAEQAVHIPQMFSKFRRSAPEVAVDDGSDIGPKAFLIDVEDESMMSLQGEADSFRPGDMLVFDPDREPKPGDFVLAHVEGEPQAVFRKYRQRGSLRGEPLFELKALNSNYGEIPIGPGGQRARVIGLMIRHIKKYGGR